MTTTGPLGAAAIPMPPPKPEGRKKGSLGRDIAIGVVIAVVVLGGFLAVKFLVLDKGSSAKTEPATGSAKPAGESQIATLTFSLPAGVTADLFVDDKKVGAFADKSTTLVNAGKHKVRVAAGDEKCERDLTLEGGKTVTVDCATLKAPAVGSGSAAAGSAAATGSAAGSAAVVGSGSAAVAVGSGSAATTGSATGSGSATTIAKVDPPKVDPPKVDPPKVDPPKVDPPKKDPPKVDPPKKDPVAKVDPPKKDPKKDPSKDKLPFEEPKKDPPPSTKDKGTLEVSANKKAKILVDNVDTGQSTPAKITVSPGKHKITLLVGEDKFTYSVTVAAGQSLAVNKVLSN